MFSDIRMKCIVVAVEAEMTGGSFVSTLSTLAMKGGTAAMCPAIPAPLFSLNFSEFTCDINNLLYPFASVSALQTTERSVTEVDKSRSLG